MEIHFTTHVFKDGKNFVAHTSELDVSSCGATEKQALRNLKEAVSLFLAEAEKMGTLGLILEEAGFLKRDDMLEGPEFVGMHRVSLPVPMLHAKEA